MHRGTNEQPGGEGAGGEERHRNTHEESLAQGGIFRCRNFVINALGIRIHIYFRYSLLTRFLLCVLRTSSVQIILSFFWLDLRS